MWSISQVDPSSPPLEYSEFRTGLTFSQVYHMIYRRRWKRRRGVLGFWCEIKRKMFREYLAVYWSEVNSLEKSNGQTAQSRDTAYG